MLVLSRKEGEKLVIGDNITLVVTKISGNRVTVGIEAPNNVKIFRSELRDETDLGNSAESHDGPARKNPSIKNGALKNFRTAPMQFKSTSKSSNVVSSGTVSIDIDCLRALDLDLESKTA